MSRTTNQLIAILLPVVLCALLRGASVAEENLELTHLGARARAMGSAHTAVADDLSALFWNPAGLAALGGGSVQADFRLRWGSGDVAGVAAIPSPIGAVPPQGFTDKLSAGATYYLIGAAASLPWQSAQKWNVVGAFAYRRIIDLEYDQQQVLQFDAGGDTIIPLEHLVQGNGGVDGYTFAIAAAPHERVHAGLNVNVLDGSVDIINEDSVTFSGFEVFREGTTVSSRVSGYSLDAGVKVVVHDMVTVGATFRPGYDVRLEEVSARIRAFVAPGAPGLEPVNIDFELPLPEQIIEVPTFFSVGIALNPVEHLLLAADYLHRPWNDARFYEEIDGQRVEDPQRLYETSTVAVGGEYVFAGERIDVPLRGGFHFAPQSAAEVDSLSADVGAAGFRTFRGGRIEGITWTLGMGLHFETVEFDIGFEQTTLTESRFVLDAPPAPGQPIFLVELDRSFSSLYFGSTLRF